MSLETVDFTRLPLRCGERVLDLGCGEGRHAITAYLNQSVTVVALDLAAADLNTAQQRFNEFHDANDASRSVSFLRASGLLLPFADSTFDKVICSEVLEHVPDYERVIAEIHRVLKPGGLFAVSVPRFGPEWLCWKLSDAYHQVEGGHIRIFKARQLQRAIESRDMFCYARHWAHGLHSPYWWLRCLFWSKGAQVWPVRTYHQFLVWDLMHKPLLTRWLDRVFNPLWGKSIVMYFVRGTS